MNAKEIRNSVCVCVFTVRRHTKSFNSVESNKNAIAEIVEQSEKFAMFESILCGIVTCRHAPSIAKEKCNKAGSVHSAPDSFVLLKYYCRALIIAAEHRGQSSSQLGGGISAQMQSYCQKCINSTARAACTKCIGRARARTVCLEKRAAKKSHMPQRLCQHTGPILFVVWCLCGSCERHGRRRYGRRL